MSSGFVILLNTDFTLVMWPMLVYYLIFNQSKSFNILSIGKKIEELDKGEQDKAEMLFDKIDHNQKLWTLPLLVALAAGFIISLVQKAYVKFGLMPVEPQPTWIGFILSLIILSSFALIADLIISEPKRKKLLKEALELVRSDPVSYAKILRVMSKKDMYIDFTIRYLLRAISTTM